SVALILDIAGVRAVADLVATQAVIETAQQAVRGREKLLHDANTYLLLRNGPDEQLAVPLGTAARIERFRGADVVALAGRRAVPYGDGMLALVSLDEVARVAAPALGDPVFVVVFKAYGREVGLLVSELVDIVDVSTPIDSATHAQPGILGSVVIDGTISLIPDLHGLVDQLLPEYRKPARTGPSEAPTVLVVEDSPFFRHQMTSFLSESGYAVLAAEDGEKGLEELQSHADEVRLVVTDIEMPRMDGLEMTRRIRTDPRFERLPILAVTSLSGDLAEKRGREAGLTEYLIKLDREQILERCGHHLA
ncbi:MAG: response regulator, partial [Deltaproteobacteria bacterium]|nr:response regulator [Deltaproteobacteria bacterium]